MAPLAAAKVLLDTNSLIYSIKQKSDLRELLFELPEVSGIVVPTCVLRELEKMSGDVMFANGALALASKFPSVEGEGPADDCILDLASREGYFVLTNDRALTRRAKEIGVRTLSFIGKRRIDFS